MNLIDLAERGYLPDAVIRVGIRQLLSRRLNEVDSRDQLSGFAASLRGSPLAVATDAANQQHYEVPPEFFQHVLGPRLKYSACNFKDQQSTLADAEEDMLRQTCDRAELRDAMRVLELGCGWGSLTLWMAEQYPQSSITAVSNSHGQREFIERRAMERGLKNVRVITADMRAFATDDRFDRIVSVEMFEHMRNYELLLKRVAEWLRPEGKAFVHIFCHRTRPYLFEVDGAANWMGRHFFTGGMMPAEHLLSEFDDDMKVEQQWRVNGLHYWRTCEAWLKNLDQHRAAILARFRQDLSNSAAKVQLQRWRMFFMACAELFRFRDGNEWFVAHYRLQHADGSHVRRDDRSASAETPLGRERVTPVQSG